MSIWVIRLAGKLRLTHNQLAELRPISGVVMKFRMACPKCHTTNFSIERDNRSYAPRGQMFEMIFSCRCGKQLFGDQIEAEYQRQKVTFESAQQTRKVELATSPPVIAQAPRATHAVAAKPSDEDDEWTNADDDDEGDDEDDDAPAGDVDICEWHSCHNPPRPNSKYCSRDCSNKNARLRYKKRKNADKAAA